MWWWFVLHGSLATAFGIFVLLTPFSGESGFVVDAVAFATLALVCGILIVIQALGLRGFDRWPMYLAIGVHSIVAGIVIGIVGGLGLGAATFWCVVSFFLVEGLMLLVGLRRSPVLRLWGGLMGSCMIAASVILTLAWLADPNHSYDIPDAGLGISGLLYGVAVLVGALQARTAFYRSGQTREV